jgi:hypothetical protein
MEKERPWATSFGDAPSADLGRSATSKGEFFVDVGKPNKRSFVLVRKWAFRNIPLFPFDAKWPFH